MQKQIKKFSFLLLAVLFVLLLLPAKSADAAVSTLLYGEFIGSTIDIHRIESDGTGDTNLTNGGSDELRGFSGLEWSPDGTKIAYVLSNPGGTQYNVHVMNADGSNDTALTTDNISGLHGGVKWSPDGTKLVFVTNSGSPDYNLNVINVDGTGRTQITSSGLDLCPQWTSTNKVVFVSLRDGNTEVYTANSDGSSPTNITNNVNNDGYITSAGYCSFDVSADGSKVVFSSDRDDAGNTYELYSANIDGSSATRLTNTPSTTTNFVPHWSNDGTMIAYGSDAHSPGGGNNDFQIYSMTAAGASETQLTSSGGNVITTGSFFSGIEWSPDDSQIAFSSNRNGSVQLFLMNADGSSQTMLVSSFSFNPRWRPAGGGDSGGDNSGNGSGTGGTNGSSSGTLANTGDSTTRLLYLAATLIVTGMITSGLLLRKQFITASDKPR